MPFWDSFLGGNILASVLTTHLPAGSGMLSLMASSPGAPPGPGCSQGLRPPMAPTPRYDRGPPPWHLNPAPSLHDPWVMLDGCPSAPRLSDHQSTTNYPKIVFWG